jgi:transcriptional regulator with XRE-family HTH domain
MSMSDRKADALQRFVYNVEDLRRREHLSVDALSERSEIPRADLDRLLRGEVDPGAGTIYRLAGALRADPGDLFDGVSWQPDGEGGGEYRIRDEAD